MLSEIKMTKDERRRKVMRWKAEKVRVEEKREDQRRWKRDKKSGRGDGKWEECGLKEKY